MAYEVIARKWRPQQFSSVVGQEHVATTLKNAIEQDRVAHSYIFVGPRGIGKTTTARIFAKALNCEKGPTATPCDKCDNCREIMAGRSLDVIEIDGASNNGVAEVRELRENVQYSPAKSSYKLYIIDEVHMLSTGAFNALLKTLEEPPSHVKFIFATTEPQKVPATILSRCQRFDLRRIPAAGIVERLKKIAEGEGVQITDEALLAIARGAEGGLRDAESALDQLIAFKGDSIDEEDVLSVFGLVSQASLDDLIGFILNGHAGGIIEVVAELDRSGKDMQRLLSDILSSFRHLLVLLSAGEEVLRHDLADAHIAHLKQWEGQADIARLLRIVQLLLDVDARMRFALSRKTVLELALLRCARLANSVSIDDILAQLNELKASIGTDGTADAEPAAPQKKKTVAEKRSAPEPAVHTEPQPAAEKTDIYTDNIKYLCEHWHELLDRVGHAAPLARPYLLDAKPESITEEQVVIGFDPEFAADTEKIEFPRNRKAVQRVLSQMLGREVTVRFKVLDAASTLPGDIKIETVKEKPAAPAGVNPKKKNARQTWESHPAVREVLETFNGDIEDIRE